MKKTFRFASATLLPLGFVAAAIGQAVTPPVAAPTAPAEVVELSPFVVNSSKDEGYHAENTLSGGRLNTSLRDTAASVSVFTQAFLEDVGIQDMEELLKYSVGSVLDTSDTGNDSLNNRGGASTVELIRIRELSSSRGRNFFESVTPDDAYSNNRYDESRGPNGILFGVSGAGGMISSTTAQASTHKDSGRLKHTFGSERQNRSEVKLNGVLT